MRVKIMMTLLIDPEDYAVPADGKVDEEMIYYAQCRGFTRKEAMRLIVTGFFQQIFDRITIESVRDALGLAIARRVRDYE